MLLVTAALLTVTGLASTQFTDYCECTVSFHCEPPLKQFPEVNCQSIYDLCCESNNTDIDTTSTTTETPPEEAVCGIRGKPKNAEPAFTFKITDEAGGDSSTSFGEFPWMVAVLNATTLLDQKFLGGGTVIYPNVILTTANKISKFSPCDLRVKAGVWNTIDPAEMDKHQDRRVVQVVVHPGFNKTWPANDVGLLILDKPLNITDNVQPICLPAEQRAVNRSSCIATGWGAEAFGKSISNLLKKVNLPLIETGTCQTQLRQAPGLGKNYNLHDSFICAGHEKVDTCDGDGGGPLMCATLDDPNRYVQIGITSWGVRCAAGFPGVYTSVESVLEWIEQQVNNIAPSNPCPPD